MIRPPALHMSGPTFKHEISKL